MGTTIINAISSILLALSVLYAARQLQLLRGQHKDNHDWNRRLAAQQAIREYRELQLMIEILRKYFDYTNRTEGIPITDFETKFKEASQLQSRLHSVLNYFEGLARGVQQGIYDEQVIKTAFRGLMIRVNESFKYYIENRRRQFHNPKIWIELETLADCWRQEEKAIEPERDRIGVDK